MSCYRCLNKTPCLYCKYICRIDNGFIYCKKHYNGTGLLTGVSSLSYCAKFKPKKNLKFILVKSLIKK
jgi:hypothetical protein